MKKNKHHNFKLEDLKKEQPFKAPDGFFDDFQSKVMGEIDAIEKDDDSTKSISRKSRSNKESRFFWSIAASVAVLVVSAYIFFGGSFSQNDQQFERMIADISTDEIVAYLEQSELEYTDLKEYISQDEFNEIDEEFDLDDFESGDAEALIEYYSL